MQDDRYIAELSKCVRCGGCKVYCPTFEEGLTEPMSARGRLTLLRGLVSNRLKPTPMIKERLFSCILCGACESSCTPGLEITESIYHGRSLLKNHDLRVKYLGLLLRLAAARPMLSFRIAKIMEQLGISPMKFLFAAPLANAPLRDERKVYKPKRKKLGRIALFTGCSVNYIMPHLGISAINTLLQLGYEVVLPRGEVCCGAPFRALGMEDTAVELAKKNAAAFGKLKPDAVLSLCPTCVLSIKVHYPRLIGKKINGVMDISSFLIDKAESISPAAAHDLKSVIYHDPCHMKYSLRVTREPRELIRFAGPEVVDSDQGGCCGFGGVFSLCYRELSSNILKKKTDEYISSDASAVITSCPGCVHQLGRGIKDKPVLHIVELMEAAICSSSDRPVIINQGG